MKRQLTTLFAACGLTGLLGTAAFAQSYQLASDIPFAFHVGEQSCASGPYTLTKTGAGTPPSMRGSKGSCALFLSFGTPLGGKSSQPKLVFHRYQDQYFLSEIWTDSGTGARLPMSQREQEVREQRPASEMASTTLYLLSRR